MLIVATEPETPPEHIRHIRAMARHMSAAALDPIISHTGNRHWGNGQVRPSVRRPSFAGTSGNVEISVLTASDTPFRLVLTGAPGGVMRRAAANNTRRF